MKARDALQEQQRRAAQRVAVLEALVAPPAPEPKAAPVEGAAPLEGAAAEPPYDSAAAAETAEAEAAAAAADAEAAATAADAEAAAAAEAEETPEELAKRVAAQWIPGGDAAAEGAAAAAEGEEAVEPDFADDEPFLSDGEPWAGEEEEPFGEGGDAGGGGAGEGEPELTMPNPALADAPAAPPGLADRFAAWRARAVARLRGAAHSAADLAAARAALAAADRRLDAARTAASAAGDAARVLARERAELDKKHGAAYGADDAFAPLAERCIEAAVEKYIYRVCPWDRAEQAEGGSPTSLGRWEALEEGGAPRMRFGGGAHCWQGPARSLALELVCGADEAVSRVAEPSRCEYTARLATPAACSAAAVDALRAEVAARRATAAAARDEL